MSPRKKWTGWFETGGRIKTESADGMGSEWVDGLAWNEWTESTGIRNKRQMAKKRDIVEGGRGCQLREAAAHYQRLSGDENGDRGLEKVYLNLMSNNQVHGVTRPPKPKPGLLWFSRWGLFLPA